MKKNIYILCIIALLSILVISVNAHSGRTDSNGGHNSDSGYHYHHGYPAHDHNDIDGDGKIDCPYDFDDKTDHSSIEKHNENTEKDESNETKTTFAGVYLSSLLEFTTFALSIVFCMVISFPIMYTLLERSKKEYGCCIISILTYIASHLLVSLFISLFLYFNV